MPSGAVKPFTSRLMRVLKLSRNVLECPATSNRESPRDKETDNAPTNDRPTGRLYAWNRPLARPQSGVVNAYVPLVEALDGRFEEPVSALPVALRERVEGEFPMPWDKASADLRRSLAAEVDAANYPADPERSHWVSFFEEKSRLEKERKQLDLIKPATITENLEKKRALEAIDQILKPMERQLARGDCPANLNPDSDEYRVANQAYSSTCRPVLAAAICKHFRVIPDEAQNEKWWKAKMRAARQNGLLDCRVGEGKKGPSSTTQWRPDLIAHWLVARYEKNGEGLSATKAGPALRHFPDCAEAADELCPLTTNA